jgi:hypothetical protein
MLLHTTAAQKDRVGAKERSQHLLLNNPTSGGQKKDRLGEWKKFQIRKESGNQSMATDTSLYPLETILIFHAKEKPGP